MKDEGGGDLSSFEATTFHARRKPVSTKKPSTAEGEERGEHVPERGEAASWAEQRGMERACINARHHREARAGRDAPAVIPMETHGIVML